MNEKLLIPIILGTNREGRQSEKVSNFIKRIAEDGLGFDCPLIDSKNFNLPKDDYGPALKSSFSDFAEMVNKADGLLIVAPEYNHGYPGVLKSLLDILLEEYKHKAVGIVSISNGHWGGIRMAENILPVLVKLGLSPLSDSLIFSEAERLFDGDEIKDKSYEKRAISFLQELKWMAECLRWGRENLK